MNTTVEDGLSSRAMFLDENHGDVVVSLADNHWPFAPIVLSEPEGEMEDEDEHGSGHEAETQVSPHTGDGKGVWVDTPKCMLARTSVLLEEDDGLCLAGDFGPFTPFMELESGGEMDGQNEQGIGNDARQRRQLAPPSEHGKGARIVDVPDFGPPSVDVVRSGKTTRIGHEVPRKFALQSGRGKGTGVSNVPHCKPPCIRATTSGKATRIGSHSKFKSSQEHWHSHALPLRSRLADHRVPYSELLWPNPLPTTRYSSSKALVTRASRRKAGASEDV